MAVSATAALWAAAAATAAGAATNAYQQKKAGERADREGRRQAQAAEEARLQQEQDFNRANRKQADLGALFDQNMGGMGGPNLTGGGAGDIGSMLGGGGMLGR